MSKQTQFAGTKNDMLEGLAFVDESVALQYVRFDKPQDTYDLEIYHTLKLFESFGKNYSGKARGAGRFFVLDREAECVVSPIPQNTGGVRFFFEPTKNPSSIVFDPSGFFENSEVGRCLLPGMIGTAQDHPDSLSLYQTFRKLFLRRFTKHQGKIYIGPEAMVLLETGTRIPSYSVFADARYDFTS